MIYIADVRPLYEEELQKKVYQRLPESRKKKADACRTQHAKAASMAVGYLAEYALRQYAGEHQKYANIEIRYEEGGQPVVFADGMKHAACISLSHSGDYAVCAVCTEPVGVDIQQEKKIKTGMLNHFFEKDEREAFYRKHGLTETKRELPEAAAREFLRDWTAKESYMKLTGKGMSIGFSNLSVDWKTRRIRENTFEEKSAFLYRCPAPKGYYLTACKKEQIK